MSKPWTFLSGVIGVSLFAVSAVVGGLLIDEYSMTSQYISETYAVDTEYGVVLRVLGVIPSGLLFVVFYTLSAKQFHESKLAKTGFIGLMVFYGLGTIIVGFFPCDRGCNKELIDPSISQMIHNLVGGLTYIFVPLSILLIGIGLKRLGGYSRLSKVAIILGILEILFVYVLISYPHSAFLGLYQRIIESIFMIWTLVCAFEIRNRT